MENFFKMDDLGGTIIFGNTHLFQDHMTSAARLRHFDPSRLWLQTSPSGGNEGAELPVDV